MAKLSAKCSDGAMRAFAPLDFDDAGHMAAWQHLPMSYSWPIVPGFITWHGKQIMGLLDTIDNTFVKY